VTPTFPSLVAVAHGSADPAAAVATRELLDAVRARRPGLDVREAYLDHTTPSLTDTLGALPGPAVVLPLLLGHAYHSRVDIPAALPAAAHRVVQADVLGPADLLVTALERRLTEAGVALGDPATAVVLAAAGSSDRAAVAEVRALAAAWRSSGWADVVAAFGSAADPTVASAVRALRASGVPRVAVSAYLLFPGRFATTIAAEATAEGGDVTAAPLGAAPEIAELVLRRYDAAVAALAASG
jgi:sirohydrochlorin ferrochelatase